jgi:hypothetical protein
MCDAASSCFELQHIAISSVYTFCKALSDYNKCKCEFKNKWARWHSEFLNAYKQSMAKRTRIAGDEGFVNATSLADILTAFDSKSKYDDVDEQLNYLQTIVFPIEIEMERIMSTLK